VVVVGLMLIEPFADVELNVPGVMVIPVAPEVVHASVLPVPESTLAGFAAKDETIGVEPFPEVILDAAPQFSHPEQENSVRASAKRFGREKLRLRSFLVTLNSSFTLSSAALHWLRFGIIVNPLGQIKTSHHSTIYPHLHFMAVDAGDIALAGCSPLGRCELSFRTGGFVPFDVAPAGILMLLSNF
jgi:hypothetical protein